ncbi:MAG: hypothetical protein GEU81_01740 [Nitriliruptorales bacterium]|nr:hypothetical protein [Nitriliruptorales bacterium]
MVRILLVTGLLLAACADDPGEPGEDPSPTAEPTLPTPGTEAATTQITGTLGGDATLEGGCAWLETPDGRYEVLYPEGYEVHADPPRLTGPDEEVIAEEGDTVVLVGHAEPEMLSICQVGPIWRALEIRQA